jgi:hypothetical protein
MRWSEVGVRLYGGTVEGIEVGAVPSVLVWEGCGGALVGLVVVVWWGWRGGCAVLGGLIGVLIDGGGWKLPGEVTGV